jgi:hypothetical protein
LGLFRESIEIHEDEPFLPSAWMLLTNENASIPLSHACERRGRTNASALMTRIDRLPFFD